MDNFSIICNLNADVPFSNISHPNVHIVQAKPVECLRNTGEELTGYKESNTEGLEESNDDNLPCHYLNMFLKKDILYWLLKKINGHSKKPKNSTVIIEDELRCFISIIYLSGYLEIPRRRLLWEQTPDCHNRLVSNAIQRDRFEYIFSKLFSLDERDENEVNNLKVIEFNTIVNHILLQHCPCENEFNIAQIDVGNNKTLKVWCGTNKSGYCNFISTFTKDTNAHSIIMHYANLLKQYETSKLKLVFDNNSIQQQLFYDLNQINIDAVSFRKNVKRCGSISNFCGIEKLRSNINLYKSKVKGKTFSHYFTFYLDIILHNAYLLYKSKSNGKSKQLDLLGFRRNVVIYNLKKHGKPIISRKLSRTIGVGKRTTLCETRFDGIRHYVIPQEKQTRCANCGMKTTTRCQKCDIGVHVKCFVTFHMKEK